MANFILIAFCLGAGIAASKFGLVPRDAFRAVNFWVINIGVPAIIFRFLPEISWNYAMLAPCLGPVLVWAGAVVYVRTYAAFRKTDPGTKTVLLAACGLGNTAFFGYPMATAFFGAEGLRIAIVFDLTTTLTFCFLGLPSIIRAGENTKKLNYRAMLKKLFTFPPAVSGILAFTLAPIADLRFAAPFLDLLVPTVAPLALFSIGMQFDLKNIGADLGHVAGCMLYRMLLAPALVLCLALLMDARGVTGMVSVFQGGTPSHMVACLTAAQFGHNPKLSILLVPVTLAGALLALPLWSLILPAVL